MFHTFPVVSVSEILQPCLDHRIVGVGSDLCGSSSPKDAIYHIGCQELCQSLSHQDPFPSHIKCSLTTGKTDPLGLSAGQSLASPGLKGNNKSYTLESCRGQWSYIPEQCHNPPSASSAGPNTSW